MGEMLVGHLKGSLQVTIVRPTIVTSTYKEPFPGWIESIRTVDSFIVGAGKGKLKCILGDPESTIYDLIPCDMVVNILLVALVAQGNQISKTFIYHASSSMYNPLRFHDLYHYIFSYFLRDPYLNPQGKVVKIDPARVFTSTESFHKHMKVHFISLLKVFGLANAILCHLFDEQYWKLEKRISFNMRIAELYKPYLFCQARYDDRNIENLRTLLEEKKIQHQIFYIDTRCIQWEEYFTKTHIPGVVKHLF